MTTEKPDGASERTVEQIAQDVADKSLQEALFRLGIDTSDAKTWRNDFYFLARMSRGANQISNVIVKTCAGAAVMGFIWIVLQGLKDWISIPGIK